MTNLNSVGFSEMTNDELYNVEGGAWWVVAGIIVGGAIIVGIGIYNGYKDTKDQKN